MVNLNTIAALDCDGENVHLIVDANSLFLSQKQLLGHEPRGNDKIDFGRVANLVTQRSAEALDADFLDLERGNSPEANPFYSMLSQIGFRLGLTPRTDWIGEDWRANLDRVLDRLSELRACSCDVYYVAGRMRHEAQSSLLELAGQGRDVWLMLLGHDSGFRSHELDQFAGSIDLVEIRAAGRHYYRGASETRRVEADPATSSHRFSAVTSDDDEQLGAIGHAFAQKAPEVLEALETVQQGEAEITAQPRTGSPLAGPEARPPLESATLSAMDESDPAAISTYVLLDHENIDTVLCSEFYRGDPAQLNPTTRPQWEKLRDHFTARSGGQCHLLSFLVDNGKNAGFRTYLESIGYRVYMFLPTEGVKVVDDAISETLRALAKREGNVVLVTHDGDFVDQLEAMHLSPVGKERKSEVIGFREMMNGRYLSSTRIGVLDLEEDLEAFVHPVPNRRTAIAISDFDAETLIASLA